jgi:hypothetical protein
MCEKREVKHTVLWDKTPSNFSEIYRRFSETSVHFQQPRWQDDCSQRLENLILNSDLLYLPKHLIRFRQNTNKYLNIKIPPICSLYTTICLFLFSRSYNPLWLYFHSPVARFSLLVFEVSWSHTRCATIGRTPLGKWSVRRRDLYLTNTTLTTDKHPCPRWDSNLQSQQASGRSPTP